MICFHSPIFILFRYFVLDMFPRQIELDFLIHSFGLYLDEFNSLLCFVIESVF